MLIPQLHTPHPEPHVQGTAGTPLLPSFKNGQILGGTCLDLLNLNLQRAERDEQAGVLQTCVLRIRLNVPFNTHIRLGLINGWVLIHILTLVDILLHGLLKDMERSGSHKRRYMRNAQQYRGHFTAGNRLKLPRTPERFAL